MYICRECYLVFLDTFLSSPSQGSLVQPQNRRELCRLEGALLKFLKHS
jgi:hypothetical protein